MTTNKRFKNVEENLEWGTVQYFTYHDEKITDTNYMINEINDYIVVKKGKKTFHKVEM